MKAAQRVLEQEIFVDHRSRGCLEWKIDAEGNKALQFTDFTKVHRPKPVEKKFPHEAAFWRYLERIRTDIDTWEIEDKREKKQKLLFVHREPLGELEFFTSEFSLNQVLCKEGDGGVQIEQCDIPLTERTQKFIVDEGNFWQSTLTVFTSEAAFMQALEKQIAQQASYKKWLGVGFIASTVGSTLLWRFSERAVTARIFNIPDADRLVPDVIKNVQSEIMTPTFLSSLVDLSWPTPSVSVFIPHVIPWAMTATFLMRRTSLLLAHPSMMLPFLLSSEITTLPSVQGQITVEDITYLKTFGGTGNDGGSAVSATADGGSVLVGTTTSFGAGNTDVLMMRMNATGGFVWARTLGGSGSNYATAVSTTLDGKSIVLGYTGPASSSSIDDSLYLLIAQLDENGSLLWSRKWGSYGYGFVGEAIYAAADGGNIIAGYTFRYGTNIRFSVFLAKVNGAGNLVWSTSVSASNTDYVNSICPTNDGGSIAVGATNNKVLVMKVSMDGDILWSRVLNGNGVANSVYSAANGESVVVGYTYGVGAGSWDVLIAKVDNNGGLLWSRTLGGSGLDSATGVYLTGSGESIVVGYVDGFGAGGSDALIAKVDNNGNLLWTRALGGAFSDYGDAIYAITNGWSIIGQTASFGAGGNDVLIAKIDENGLIPNCPASQTISPIFGNPFLNFLVINFTVASIPVTSSNSLLTFDFVTKSLQNNCNTSSSTGISSSTGMSSSTGRSSSTGTSSSTGRSSSTGASSSTGTSSYSQIPLIGAAVGGIAGLGAIVGIWCWRKKRHQQDLPNNHPQASRYEYTGEVTVELSQSLNNTSVLPISTLPLQNYAITLSPAFKAMQKRLEANSEFSLQVKSLALPHYAYQPKIENIHTVLPAASIAPVALSEKLLLIAQGLEIVCWDIKQNKSVQTFRGHTSEVTCLAILPNGQIVSGARDGTLRLWQLSSGECVRTLQRTVSWIQDKPVAISHLLAISNETVITVENDGKIIYVWQVDTGEVLGLPLKHKKPIAFLVKQLNGLVLSSDGTERVSVWDIKQGIELEKYFIGRKDESVVALLPEGSFVTTDNVSQKLYFHSLETGLVAHEFPLSLWSEPVRHVMMLPDKQRMLINNTIVDMKTKQVIQASLPGNLLMFSDGVLGVICKNSVTRLHFPYVLPTTAWQQLFSTLSQTGGVTQWDLSEMIIPDDAFYSLLSLVRQYRSLQIININDVLLTEDQLLYLWAANQLRTPPAHFLSIDSNITALQQKYTQRKQSDATATLWHLAVQEGHQKLLEVLSALGYKQGLNVASAQGLTPLHEAVRKRQKAIVQWLVEHEAPLRKNALESREILFQLGALYEKGDGEVTPDILQAAEWYRQASQKQHFLAAYSLGQLHFGGSGVKQNIDEAVKYYRKALEGNVNEAYAALFRAGRLYEAGQQGVVQNITEAVKCYLDAAKGKVIDSYYPLAQCYASGRGIAQNLQEAVKYYRLAAENNVLEAQYQLAFLLEEGKGVKQDFQEAARYYMATKKKYPDALYRLGLLYLQGQGIYQNTDEAAKCFQAAGIQKHLPSQLCLALLYYAGNTTLITEEEAVQAIEAAATQGDALAQCSLGVLYEEGRGVALDVETAFEWYEKAANQGYATAQFHVGRLYELGKGMAKEIPEAIQSYLRAAKQKYAPATERINALYTDWAKEIAKVQEEFKREEQQRKSSQASPLLMVLGPVVSAYFSAVALKHTPDFSSNNSRASVTSLGSRQHKQSQDFGAVEFSLSIPYKELKFNKEDEIGRGGYGVVYKGTWRSNDVAIKQVGTRLTGDELNEFKQEMLIQSQLRCPQVVQLYGVSTDEDSCIVMEYMEKGSLYKVLHSNTVLDWSRRYGIALDIAKGLNFLHHGEVVHRDLKSLNVLLNENWQAKLCDFGLAKLKKAGMSSSGGQQIGTLPWMAPEIMEEEKYTEKSDIYSYGVLLWEMAARQIPFQGKSQVAIINAVVNRDKREEIPTDTPAKFTALINRCWDKDPGKRPKSEELISELKVMREEKIPEAPIDPNSSFRGNLVSRVGLFSATANQISSNETTSSADPMTSFQGNLYSKQG